MSTNVQSSVFKNAGIKRGVPFADDYDPLAKEDFGLEQSSGNFTNDYFNENISSIDATDTLTNKPLFDFDLGDMDLKGMGSIAQGIGSIWDAYNKKEYQDEIVKMEKERVNREVAKQAKAQSAFDAAWA